MNLFGKKPRSDGIRRRAVDGDFSIPEARIDPHEEEGIIITEPVFQSESKSESIIGSKVKPLSSPSSPEDGQSYEESGNTFSLDSEVVTSDKLKSRLLWRGLFGGLGLAFFIVILLSTIFASTTITLKPRLDILTLPDTLVLLDSSVSRPLIEQRVIPAERLEFNKKMAVEFESTGREYIEEKARGKVKIYNRFSSAPQTLVGGTRFLTEAGVLYRLLKSVVIPGARIEEGKIIPEAIEVELAADKSGEEGNLNGELSLKISGFKGTAKYEGFYALASVGFSGGFRGEARVVSKDDLKKAEEQVTKQIYEALQKEMARKIPLTFKILDGLREIQITKLDAPSLNSRRDRFSVEATGGGRLLVFREGDLVALLKEIALKDDKTREYVNNSASLEYQVKNIDLEKGRAEMTVRGNLRARALISKENLAELIKNKKEGSIIEVLKNRNEIATFSIVFFPPWFSGASLNPAKIRFRMAEE